MGNETIYGCITDGAIPWELQERPQNYLPGKERGKHLSRRLYCFGFLGYICISTEQIPTGIYLGDGCQKLQDAGGVR